MVGGQASLSGPVIPAVSIVDIRGIEIQFWKDNLNFRKVHMSKIKLN